MRCMALCVLQIWDIVGEKILLRFLFIGFSCCLEERGMLDATGNFSIWGNRLRERDGGMLGGVSSLRYFKECKPSFGSAVFS